MTPLRIGATLRIQDSLQAGRSRFFAEITQNQRNRRDLCDLGPRPRLDLRPRVSTSVPGDLRPRVRGAVPARRAAGRHQLARSTGRRHRYPDRGCSSAARSVLATTHDLALTAMVEGLGGRAVNVHFEDRFDDGVLTFDYRLKPGVVQSSNAIALMRAVGLDV